MPEPGGTTKQPWPVYWDASWDALFVLHWMCFIVRLRGREISNLSLRRMGKDHPINIRGVNGGHASLCPPYKATILNLRFRFRFRAALPQAWLCPGQ
jgi:hypothetical protein